MDEVKKTNSFDINVYLELEKIITLSLLEDLKGMTKESFLSFFEDEEEEIPSADKMVESFINENQGMYYRDLQFYVYYVVKNFEEIKPNFILEDFLKEVKMYKSFYDSYNKFLFTKIFKEKILSLLEE